MPPRNAATSARPSISPRTIIGATKNIWLEEPDEDDDEDSDVSQVHTWRENNTNKYQERQALAELIAADIAAYLADIGTNATISAAQLAVNQLRAAVWFGVGGYVNSEEENASLDDPEWNPLAWAWEQTAENIAEHVAAVTAENIAQLYNGDRDFSADADTAAALVAMFEIPLDVIATRASEALHTATRAEQNADSQDDVEDTRQDIAEDTDTATVEDSPEPAAAMDADELTDPEDFIPLADVPFLHALAGVDASTPPQNKAI